MSKPCEETKRKVRTNMKDLAADHCTFRNHQHYMSNKNRDMFSSEQ